MVPAGATTATFVATAPSNAATELVAIYATYGGSSSNARMQVNAAPKCLRPPCGVHIGTRE